MLSDRSSSVRAASSPSTPSKTPESQSISSRLSFEPACEVSSASVKEVEAIPPSQKWSRGPYFWRSFVAICLPLLLSALEGSVTNTALPTISSVLKLGTKFSWVATAFLLSSTIFQPLYEQLADLWGRKYPLLAAVVVFGIGSAMCGAAGNGQVLITGRVVQGLGTGGIDLFAELILCDLVPLRKRGVYTAIKHVVFAIGTSIGPLLGGVFAESNWRWCFYVNLPVCGLALLLIFFWLQVGNGGTSTSKNTSLRDQLRRVDGPGTALLTSAVVLILFALSSGGSLHPWSAPAIVIPLTLGIIGLLIFPFYESSRFCSAPIMPPSIFSNRTSAAAFALTAIHGFLTYGYQFYLPPFFQAVRGSSPTKSGIEILPTTLVIVALAAIGGPLLTCFGKYRPIHQGGFASMVLGFGLCTTLTKSTPVAAWVVFQLLVAVGSGIIVSIMLPAVSAELPDRAIGQAAGAWAFLRGTGSLFGVAVPGAMFNVVFAGLLPSISSEDARARLGNGRAYQHASEAFVRQFGKEVQREIVAAFTQSLKGVWIVFVVVAGVGLCLTFVERQVKLRKELDTEFGLKGGKKSGSGGVATETEETGPEKEELQVPADTRLV